METDSIQIFIFPWIMNGEGQGSVFSLSQVQGSHIYFYAILALYSFIYVEGKTPANLSILYFSSFFCFFHSPLWIVGISVISKLLLYHFLFIYAAVFVQSLGGLWILLKHFLFYIIFYIHFPVILYLTQSIHPTAPLLSA